MLSRNSTTTITETEEKPVKKEVQHKIVWRNVVLFAYLHLAALYGIYLAFTSAMLKTTIFGCILYVISGLGITAGAHRLWAHRSYKANLPLRILLGLFNTVAFQNHIYEWARDHRVHHKFSDTDADPHNINRGFFFSHVGWLMMKKHPDVMEKGKTVEFHDMLQDPVVRFQKKYYLWLVLVFCFVLPTYIPMALWGESFKNAFLIPGILRLCFTLNMTWLVNSAAHSFGSKPYDKNINPSENRFVSLGAIGEGWHNYHHTFPWDYSTSELGWKINLTTMFIDFFAWMGWAYDLKKVPKDVVQNRIQRTGTPQLKTLSGEVVTSE